jgi:cytidyltransferase-like protein
MNKTHPQPQVIVLDGFDDLRVNDIRFLQEAQRLGSVHVFLYSDQAYQTAYGKPPKFKLDERKYYLESIRYTRQVSTIEIHDPGVFLTNKKFLNADDQRIIWAVRERTADKTLEKRSLEHDIEYAVIPDSALAGFPNENAKKETIEEISKPTVMVSGCFDWVHTGHVRFFEEASAYGDLYVVVGHDENLRLLKGEGHPLFPQEERKYWVQSIRFVKKAIISTGHGWLDAEPQILSIKPDVYIVNEDGDRPEKRTFLRQHQIDYIVLEREPKPGLPRRISTDLRGF